MNRIFIYLLLILSVTMLFSSDNEDIDKLFQKANEAEFEAESKEDFEKVIELYKTIVMDYGEHPNRELLASCIYSIAQIYAREFKLTEQPQGLYEMILEYYPDTSWAGRAREALGKTDSGLSDRKISETQTNSVRNPFGNIGIKGAKKASARVVSSYISRDAMNMKDDILSSIGKKIRVTTQKVMEK